MLKAIRTCHLVVLRLIAAAWMAAFAPHAALGAPIIDDVLGFRASSNSYTLPATSFTSLRAGVKLGNWQLALFCDNVFDSHTVLNYAQIQPDPFNPAYNPLLPNSVQQNNFTFRPRTVGVTATFRD